jgi:hypothetical protein
MRLQMKGIDMTKAKEFLKTKGMYSFTSDSILIDSLDNMDNFTNPLKVPADLETLNNMNLTQTPND